MRRILLTALLCLSGATIVHAADALEICHRQINSVFNNPDQAPDEIYHVAMLDPAAHKPGNFDFILNIQDLDDKIPLNDPRVIFRLPSGLHSEADYQRRLGPLLRNRGGLHVTEHTDDGAYLQLFIPGGGHCWSTNRIYIKAAHLPAYLK